MFIGSLKSNIKKIIIIAALLFTTTACGWCQYLIQYPEKEVYFSDSFEKGIDEWESLDSSWIAQEDKNIGIVKLARKIYETPYVMKTLLPDNTPSPSYIWHIRFKVNAFTNDAFTLATLILPTDQITLIINKDNYIGLSGNLFDTPKYSNNFSHRFPRGVWNDIYVQVDGRKSSITVYKHNTKIFSTEFKSNANPVQEVWLGTIWLNGGGYYGSALDVSFDSVTIGSEGLLPKASFIEYALRPSENGLNIIKPLFD